MRRPLQQRRGGIEIELDPAVEKPLQQRMIGRIARDHAAGDPAQQYRAEPDQNWQPVEHHHDERRTGNNHRDADRQPKDQQRKLAIGGGGDRDDIVEAHDDVGDHDNADGVPEAGAGRDVVTFLVGHQQFGRDHNQRKAADQLQIGQHHQRRDDTGECDQQQPPRCRRRSPCPTGAAPARGRDRPSRSPARCRPRAER